MMGRFVFHSNDNNKLNCDCFTTIRLYDAERHVVGKVYEIWLNGQRRSHEAKIIEVKLFYLKDLNAFMTRIDMDKPVFEARSRLADIYRKVYNLEQVPFAFILFKKEPLSIADKAKQLTFEEFREEMV